MIRSPVSLISVLDRLYGENPHAMEMFLSWVQGTEYGTVTLVFRERKLCVVEHTETAK